MPHGVFEEDQGSASGVFASSQWPDASKVGAVYDDATDCTTALQNALNNYGGFILTGPVRVSQLSMPAGSTIQGGIPGGYGVLIPNGTNPPHGRISQIAGTNAPLLLGAQGAAHVRLRRIHLDGNKNNNTSGDVIHLNDVGTAEEAQWLIDGCYIESAAGYCVYVGVGRRAVKMVNLCAVENGGDVGIRWNGSDGGIHNCIVGGHHGDCIQVGASVLHIAGNDIYGSATGNGINVLGTITQILIENNGIDRNALNGIYLAPSTAGISIVGNALHSNSQTTNGSAHHINVQTTTGGATIDANTFATDGGVVNNPGYCIFLNGAGVTAKAHGNTLATQAAANLGLTNDFTRLLV